MPDISLAILSPYAWGRPQFGGQARIFEIAKSLGEKGVKVDLYSGDISEQVELRNIEVVYWNELYGLWNYIPVTRHNAKRLVRRTWHTFRGAKRFKKSDVIICELLNTAWHGLVLQKLLRRPAILDEHNIEWSLVHQTHEKSRYNWRLVKEYENFCWKSFNRIIVTSHDDKNRVLRGDDTKVSVVPNGVDCQIFTKNEEQRESIRRKYSINDRPILLFMGSFGYFPNVDAVQRIVEEIYPRVKKSNANALFMIIGREADCLTVPSKTDFLVPGMVEDVVSHINASDICIAPIRYGSGTRIKILEWMACGKAVIATEKAAEGLEVTHGENIIIENDLVKYDFWISKLLAEPDFKSRIENNASNLVRMKHDWRVCILPMVKAIESAIP